MPQAHDSTVHGLAERIGCVKCHVTEGAKGFAEAKFSGIRQLVHVVTNSIPAPIPSGTRLREGAQAGLCLECHQPDRIAGDQIHLIREYADDEANTETLTILQMHTGATSTSGRAIHWHADQNHPPVRRTRHRRPRQLE